MVMLFYEMLSNSWGPFTQGNWGPTIAGGEQGGYGRIGSSIVVVTENADNTVNTFSMNGTQMFVIKNPNKG